MTEQSSKIQKKGVLPPFPAFNSDRLHHPFKIYYYALKPGRHVGQARMSESEGSERKRSRGAGEQIAYASPNTLPYTLQYVWAKYDDTGWGNSAEYMLQVSRRERFVAWFDHVDGWVLTKEIGRAMRDEMLAEVNQEVRMLYPIPRDEYEDTPPSYPFIRDFVPGMEFGYIVKLDAEHPYDNVNTSSSIEAARMSRQREGELALGYRLQSYGSTYPADCKTNQELLHRILTDMASYTSRRPEFVCWADSLEGAAFYKNHQQALHAIYADDKLVDVFGNLDLIMHAKLNYWDLTEAEHHYVNAGYTPEEARVKCEAATQREGERVNL
jgi:hypothetical protein